MKSSKKPYYWDIKLQNGFGSGKGGRSGIRAIILCIILLSLDIGITRASVEVGHGFLKQDSLFPHWFSFDDGTYPYLVGTTNYDLMGTPDQNISDTIDWQSQFFNVMRVSLRPKRDLWQTYNKTPSFDINLANPFGGSWASPIFGWSQSYWDRFNSMMNYAASKGMIIELIICRDGRNEYNLLSDSTTFNKFMADTSKHWNLMYNIANEWEENISSSEVISLAQRINAADQNKHLVSVHGLGTFSFWTEAWADFAAHQYGSGVSSSFASDLNSHVTGNWSNNLPQINEEYGYEGRITADEVLLRHWAILAGGGMGFYGHSPARLEGWYMIGKGWGSSGTAHTWLGHMRDFMNTNVQFWKMVPDNTKLMNGTGWVLAENGKEYLVVLPSGGMATMDLTAANGTLDVKWFNPKTGQVISAGNITGGSNQSFTAPFVGVAVLHITKKSDISQLGQKVTVGSGEDPDIAVGSDGTLHVVYHRTGTVYYRKGSINGGFSSEITVGAGTDPRIALDNLNDSHIVMGSGYDGGATVKHAKWSGGTLTVQTVVSSGNNRKPRIEIDQNNNAIISFEDRQTTSNRVKYIRVSPDGITSEPTVVGNDDIGGLGVGGGKYHFTWRGGGVNYVISNGPGNVGTAVSITPAASDFSELDINPSDNSVHVVATVSAAGGIYYVNNTGGIWNSAKKYAVNEISGGVADNINPAVAVDKFGRIYITFSDKNQLPSYITIDENGVAGNILNLDSFITGDKYKNPNIEEAPNGGAYVAWAAGGTVYVNSIGLDTGSTPPSAPLCSNGQCDGTETCSTCPQDCGVCPSAPPTAPTNLSATAVSSSQADLSWTASFDPESGISRYNIYRDDVLIGNSTQISFSDIGLAENTTHSYQVSAVNGAGLESQKSSSISATTLSDTTPPTIISVTAEGDLTRVAVVFSEPVEQSSAMNAGNYSINNSIAVSSVSLGGDFKTVTLTTSPHQEGITYTLTVSNVKDRAKNPNTILPNSQVTYTFVAQLIISNLTIGSGKAYEVTGPLSNGSLAYIDRSFTYGNVPSFFNGEATHIKTANNDKLSQGDIFLSFDVNQDVTVYIAHDDRYQTKPSWLQNFSDTGANLNIDSPVFSLFKKDFPQGRVTLGGNTANGAGDNNMYTVIIMGKGGTTPPDTTPPAAPVGLRIQ